MRRVLRLAHIISLVTALGSIATFNVVSALTGSASLENLDSHPFSCARATASGVQSGACEGAGIWNSQYSDPANSGNCRSKQSQRHRHNGSPATSQSVSVEPQFVGKLPQFVD